MQINIKDRYDFPQVWVKLFIFEENEIPVNGVGEKSIVYITPMDRSFFGLIKAKMPAQQLNASEESKAEICLYGELDILKHVFTKWKRDNQEQSIRIVSTLIKHTNNIFIIS